MKVLVVDDDRVLADVVAFTLRRDGFEVILAYDGLAGLQRWKEDEPDLVILDINLPKMDGFSLCRRIREQAEVPIILLTVRSEEDDIIRGLHLGADDYVVKPFSPRQLVARARAVLRRAGGIQATADYHVGAIRYDPTQRAVIVGERTPISLTPLEGRLLEILMVNAGQVLTTDALIDHIWGPSGGDRDMLRQLIRRLRAKIEPQPSEPIYIKTISGLGYGLVMER
jgi:DNA-binding response OmpR family regulator